MQPSFGHITHKALDIFRKTTEGYTTKVSFDFHSKPVLDEFYKLRKEGNPRLNSNQVSLLSNFVERASKLKKTVINLNDSMKPSIKVQTVEHGRLMQDGGRTCYEFSKSDIEGNLDIFKKAVERAEQIEKDPGTKFSEFTKEMLAHRCKDDYLKSINSQRIQPEFREIYQKTIDYTTFNHDW